MNPYSVNPDPAKNLYPDPVPDPDPSHYRIFLSKEVNWMTECCKSHYKVKLCSDYLIFKTFFKPLDPNPDSGSRGPLNPDPISIRIRNTALIQSQSLGGHLLSDLKCFFRKDIVFTRLVQMDPYEIDESIFV